ncbi:MAG: hypothetical protein QOC79_791 [Actinomycetota bacterium]|nr:hypothetical protein [Actinomycetota bacterium]
MRFITRRAPFVIAVALAITLVGAVPASAASALVVTPNTDLVDFQTVSATGSGFAANTTVVLLECQATAVDVTGCDLGTLTYQTTDDTGSYTTNFVVQRLIDVGAGEVDCAPSACVLATANFDATNPASAPLGFDPNVPPQPRLHLDLTVDPKGTVVSKTGVVTVRGTVTCNLPADVFVDVYIEQRAGRVLLDGEAFTEDIPCNGTTPWSATGQAYSGIFKGGSAQVDANAFGSSGPQNAYAEVFGTIKLAGAGK